MVGFRKVPSLKDCVKKEIPTIIKNYIIKSAYNLNIQWYVILAGYPNCSSEQILTIQMERFRQYLLDNVVWTDRQEIFYLILRGVDDGIMKVRRGWSREKKHDQYMKVMEAVTLFADTVQFPDLRAIDFREIPRTIRYRIVEMIPCFTGLKVLIIGPGPAGSWIPVKGKTASELSCHLNHLKHLEHFSLKKDCNMKILTSLVQTCKENLKILDVENSSYLQDEAVRLITDCRRLEQLHITGTNISDEGLARVIMGLTKLKYLVRADFLADALGWIDYLEEMEDPVFDIRDFLPSTTYFFHESWQMEMVSRMCPNIQKMLFIQHPKCCPTLAPLESFTKLTDLQIHGSDWGSSGLVPLVEKVGGSLQNLGLIAIKGMSPHSLEFILDCCPDLNGLVLNNCDFAGTEEPRLDLVQPNLQELVVTSNIRTQYVEWLLRAGANLKVIHLGGQIEVSDEMFLRLTQANHLQKLEEIQIERSASLSLETLNCILSHCNNIRSVGDLAAWAGVTGKELGEMIQIVHEQNLALDLSSHQVLRRFLGLTGEDRRQMMTLMTGPVLERIRMAQEEARIQGGNNQG